MPVTKEIAMRNRKNGDAFEFRIMRKEKKKKGNEVVRSSGSHGIFDLWILKGTTLRLIQCKRNGYIKPKERKEIAKFMETMESFVQVEVHIQLTARKMKKYIIRKVEDLEKFKKVTFQD